MTKIALNLFMENMYDPSWYPKSPKRKGVIYWEEGQGVAYVYVCIED